MKTHTVVAFSAILTLLLGCSMKQKQTIRDVWTKEQANTWYKKWGWLRSSDFIPSTAINQLGRVLNLTFGSMIFFI
jgi:hypothetical protein